MESDRRMMARAIALSRRGEGRVEPNPMVGCVITRRGRIIGEGYHHRFGGPHAEIEALRACTVSPRGATVYVSLEPCCHQGKTPPCTDALIEAGVARVVTTLKDPNATVDGRGIRRLRSAGVSVETGLLAEESAEVLAPFLTRTRLGRPYVIAKWAQSLDGKLATRTGHSQWISGEPSRRCVHGLRARVDAVLVGSGTVLSDDPMLTARDVPLRRRATRVVLDGRLRIPDKCQLVDTAGEIPTLVFTTRAEARTTTAGHLTRKGVEIAAVRSRRGRLVINDCLKTLCERGMTNVLVEGGPTILTAFFNTYAVDEAMVFTAPILIGGADTPGPLLGCGAPRVDEALKPRAVTTRRYGLDILHHLRLSDLLIG